MERRLAIAIVVLILTVVSTSAQQQIDGGITQFLNSQKVSSYSKQVLSQQTSDKDLRWIVTYKKDKLVKLEKQSNSDKKIGRDRRLLTGKITKLREYLSNQDVRSIELDQPAKFASDTIPWNINLTRAPTAWNTTTGTGVSVAILDSGIGPHPDIQVAGGVSIIGSNYNDSYGHGTAVAGVLSAVVNDYGLVGVAPGVDLYSVKITDGPTGYVSDALAGLEWATAHNMSVISMSFGFNEYSPAFASAVQDAWANGAILVAAAGNDGGNVTYPARYPPVIAVGAVDHSLNRTSFSNIGHFLDLMAPGVAINTTWTYSSYTVLSGTSFASPHVAGVAALLIAKYPNLTNNQISSALFNSAIDLGDPGKDDLYGYGLVSYNAGLNLSSQNTSGYYTVYNITLNGTQEVLTYLTNGTGLHVTVNFSKGLYLINFTQGNTTFSERINVSDNGQFNLLGPEVQLTDSFNSDSTTFTDGKGFKNDASTTAGITGTTSNTDAYCLDFSNDDIVDYCGYKSGVDEDCETFSSNQNDEGEFFYDACVFDLGDCVLDTALDDTPNAISAGSITQQTVKLVYYTDCDDSSGLQDYTETSFTGYIVDRRRGVCTSSSQYQMQGRYTTGGTHIVYKDAISCGAGTTCDSSVDDEIFTTNKSTSINPCRKNEGQSCDATEQCLQGLTCSSGTCSNITANVTDLKILELIPIQVIPNVPMILQKSGYVLVRVLNNGTNTATANVSVSFNGLGLTKTLDTINPRTLTSNQSALFKFTFKPTVSGPNLFINATVVTS